MGWLFLIRSYIVLTWALFASNAGWMGKKINRTKMKLDDIFDSLVKFFDDLYEKKYLLYIAIGLVVIFIWLMFFN